MLRWKVYCYKISILFTSLLSCCCFSHSMDFHLLTILLLTFLTVQLAITHALPTQEVYWQSVLPNIPMPEVLCNLLPSEQKSDTRCGKQPISKSFQDNAMVIDLGNVVSVDVGNGVTVSVEPPFISGSSPLLFNYGASKNELRSNQNGTLFFLEKDLRINAKMKLYFTKTDATAKFLPRQVAETTPFSSKKFSEILHRFSIKTNSTKAEIMKKTIEECELPALEGEDKFCATSLEAMVDFSSSMLGKIVQILATQDNKNDRNQQDFSITQGVRKVGSKFIACHPQSYVYPVYYCHKTHATKAYTVPLIGDGKTSIQAVAICHTDTSKWNPMHLAFQVLKVKPGAAPICHFLPENHIIWVAK